MFVEEADILPWDHLFDRLLMIHNFHTRASSVEG
jgi:hypothetical protein